MKLLVQLIREGLVVETATITQPDTEDGEFYLSVRVADIVKHWNIESGDTIATTKVEE